MRLNLDLDLCKKLLAVFTTHDRNSCTDQNKSNQYANSAGWVSCTRCWLLQIVQDNCVPEDVEFEIYSTIKLKKKEITTLIAQYVDLINEFDIDHPNLVNFIEAHKNNREFMELMIIAKNLKKRMKENKNQNFNERL